MNRSSLTGLVTLPWPLGDPPHPPTSLHAGLGGGGCRQTWGGADLHHEHQRALPPPSFLWGLANRGLGCSLSQKERLAHVSRFPLGSALRFWQRLYPPEPHFPSAALFSGSSFHQISRMAFFPPCSFGLGVVRHWFLRKTTHSPFFLFDLPGPVIHRI